MVERIFVLSAAHIHTGWDFGKELRPADTQQGTVLYLGECADMVQRLELIGAQPLWLQPIVQKALELGCSYIDFNADGSLLQGLTVYDYD